MDLKISLIHLNVHHKEIEKNRNRLLELNRKAAKQGSRLMINTELALSEYSFSSFKDIHPYTETINGPAIKGLKEIARNYKTHILFGFAEVDQKTGIYYNSAVMIDEKGKILCHYQKITAETRWACPGNPIKDNTFETPFGKMGVLICSDTYHSLMPRQTALRGANMILVPANWPDSGLDPRELWRARAMENGVYLIACNRGGVDKTMSCENAWSAAYGPNGEELAAASSDRSKIISLNIHLPNTTLCMGLIRKNGKLLTTVHLPNGYIHKINHSKFFRDNTGIAQKNIINAGPVRIGISSIDALKHPEMALSLSKLGCDLIIASAESLNERDFSILSIKSIEKSVIAIAARNRAFISQPPIGHSRWKESKAESPFHISVKLNSNDTRNKTFQDRLDFNCPLNRHA